MATRSRPVRRKLGIHDAKSRLRSVIARCFPPNAQIIELFGQTEVTFAIALRQRPTTQNPEGSSSAIRIRIPQGLLGLYVMKPKQPLVQIDKAIAEYIRQQLPVLEADRSEASQLSLYGCLERLDGHRPEECANPS